MKYLLVFLFCLFTVQMGFAYPELQLDIVSGTYENETVITDNAQFTLRCILTPGQDPDALVGNEYFLTMAVIPQYKDELNPDPDLGYFTFSGANEPLFVTNSMEHGTPPEVERHGVFPDYYYDYGFNFIGATPCDPYDVQNNVGLINPTYSTGGAYYKEFTFDLSGLMASGAGIHFDLYTTNTLMKETNAPYSHDAQCIPSRNVPEPSSLILLSIGFGLVLIRSVRRVKKAKEYIR